MSTRTLTAGDRKIITGLGQIERKTKLGDFLGTMRDDLDVAVLSGVAGYAELELSTHPTHQDTIPVGRDTYECINTATGTAVADDGNIAVVRGANAAAFLANIIAAINGRADAEHATVTMADAVTPAIGIGSEKVYAFASGTKLCIRRAVTRGGTVLAGGAAAAAITLGATTLTSAQAWNVTDLGKLGLDTYAGRVAGLKFAVTTAMLASGRAQFEAAFDIRSIVVDVRDANGKKKTVLDDAFTFSGKVVTATLAGAAVASKTEKLSQSIPATASVSNAWQHNFGVAVDCGLKAVIPEDDAGGALTCTVNKIAANGTRTALVTGADLTGATPRVPFTIPGLTVPFALASTEALEVIVIGGAGLSAPTAVTAQVTYHEDVHSLANTDVVTIIAIG